jgi:PKD repeat protein
MTTAFARTASWVGAIAVVAVMALGALGAVGGPFGHAAASSVPPPAAAPVALGAPAPNPAGLSSADTLLGPYNASAVSAPGWENVTGTSNKSPAPRSYGRSFAYDPVDHYLVMFGGYGAGGNYLDDTWTYNGTWTQIHPKTSPIARDHSTLAWDPLDGYLLLFGGSGNSGVYDDTWTFLHGNWTELSPTDHPSGRWASAMTWDAGDHEMVLFGGCGGSALDDTWTFVGGNWTELTPVNHPSARENVALRFDPSLNETILFGGDDYNGWYDSDTWAFQAGNWTEINGTVHPAARTMASFAYDPAVGGMVLYGGQGTTIEGDTWWFVNGTWSEQNPVDSPPARYFGELAFDPALNALVLWGGAGNLGDMTDTWMYVGFNVTASASALELNGPGAVNFTATAWNVSGPVGYLWNFGDGNTSTARNASDWYGTAGRYTASVTVTDANGSAATASFVLRAYGPLTVGAVASPTTGLVPLTVDCVAIAQGGSAPYTYSWTSGVAANVSTESRPTFVYGAPGAYTLKVVVTDAEGASWNESFSIQAEPVVIAPLTASIVASSLSGPAPLTVWFASGLGGGVAPYVASWNFGTGATATGPTVNYTFTASGNTDVVLTVTDARGLQTTTNVTVLVSSALSAQGEAPTSAVANTSATFSATVTGGEPPYQTVWNFGDSEAASAADTTHVYARSGTYQATFTVTDARGATVSHQYEVLVAAGSSSGTPPSGTSPTGSGGAGGLSDADVYGLAILGGAAIIAVAIVLVRRFEP